MKLLRATLLSWALVAPTTAAPLHFVYRGAGCTGLAAIGPYERLIGRRVDGVVDFVDYLHDWETAVSAANWGINCWKPGGYRLALSIPLAVTKGEASGLDDVAAGKAQAYYQRIATALVVGGFSNAYLRLGWEFNGGWYPWGGRNPAQVAQAFRAAHDALASVKGARFRFVWNPALYTQAFDPTQAYPGDRYVDVIAADVYASSGLPLTHTGKNVALEPALTWSVFNNTWGIKSVVAFAKKHGKPYAFPEWGAGDASSGQGSGDDAYFIEQMAPVIGGAEFEGYWDYNAGDYNSQVSSGERPAIARALRAGIFAPAP